ncbi:MAG TPA: PHB depolymerase family esterase [Solirubrobacteraceae bacterium]|nr:PHB depolymerase family esterase [Solirubrobacteraceae bacterium]
MFRTRTALLAAAVAAIAATAPADARPPTECVTDGAAGTAYEVGVNCRTVEVDGIDRRYLVYVPDRRPATGDRAPVVFMFHGTGGDGERFLRTSGWREQADATGLVAVFPTARRYLVLESGRRKTKWNAFGLEDKIDGEPADDVGFVDGIVAELGDRLPIDRHRIYAAGFSNGADFAARLSVERSDRIAAAAYSAGGLTEPHSPDRPVPTAVSLGTRDDHLLEGTGLDELPLDPFEILASPITGPFLDANLATFGLDPDRFGVIARRRSTTLRWPATGNGPVFQFRMVARLRHKYADDAAERAWTFFRRYVNPTARAQ